MMASPSCWFLVLKRVLNAIVVAFGYKIKRHQLAGFTHVLGFVIVTFDPEEIIYVDAATFCWQYYACAKLFQAPNFR